MPAYAIGYDLFKGDRDDYEELYEALEKGKAVRVTESSWYVSTAWDATRLTKYLRTFMHADDVLTVDALLPGPEHCSVGLTQEALAWRKKYLSLPKVPPRR